MSEEIPEYVTTVPSTAMTSAPLFIIPEDDDSLEMSENVPVGNREGMAHTDEEEEGEGTGRMGSTHATDSDGDEFQEKGTEAESLQKEGKNITIHVTDDISENSSSNNGDSVSKNGHHSDQGRRQPRKKHVVWQTDHEVSADREGGCTDQPADCDSVVAGEQTDHPPSPACPNTDLTELDIQHGEDGLSVEGIKRKDPCLAAQGNNGITGPIAIQNCPREEEGCSSSQSINTDRREGSNFCYHPNLSGRRRPASANDATKRERRLLETQVVSEELLKPFSAGSYRRLSLPLDLRRGDSKENLQRFGDSEHVNKPTDASELRLDVFVQEVEKETRKAISVTYSEQEKTKESDVVTRHSPVPKSKPPRGVPPRTRGNRSHRRPHTAGAASTAAGGRPSDRRMIHSAPARTSLLRPWEMRFTKEELQRALPRRNFFSCHNKALKDAGFEVEEENARPRRRRLLFFHHEDEPEETPTAAAAAAPPAISEPQISEKKAKQGGEDPINIHSDHHVETVVQMLSVNERAKRRKSQLPQVECKPLQLYLTYVAENPGEYRHMLAKSSTSGPAAALHPSSHPADNCHTARLVSMGRIFQEKHGGLQKTDEVLRAAYTLNPRDADPFCFAGAQRNKSPLVPGMVSRKQSSLPNFPRKESAVSSHSGEDNSKSSGQRSKPGSEMMPRHEAEKLVLMDNLTEIEKLKLKAEEWARCVTTEQLVRAKLQVLKELGHEGQELSQWWLAFRSCSYLRTRIRE